MKHQQPELAACFEPCDAGDVVISSITQAELDYGVACSGRQRNAPQKQRLTP
jgi:tRNA(fMet)-specific endonuclease VapC